ncbi:ABC-2 type transporter family protein [Synechococcus sp. SYN20]|uniref:ABC transporter permease n=1 Tax=Synechococcus sp. SYN20 TaxID=1050714 RepID=UPI001644D58C|nr:ABC transporter permease [Synechococcus sp. SYN20]QNJ25230.1 ABC-2 type transporter family protein [Synechococcus sp. SYN20]
MTILSSHRTKGILQRLLTIGRERLQETLALSMRQFLQIKRRPSSFVVGVIQPLIWLILFSALFSNAPKGFLPYSMGYGHFITAGLIVFTAFSGALNAGLPVMFDREFGFLNRILVAPLRSRSSVVLASVVHIGAISLIQSIFIMIAAGLLGYGWPSGLGALTTLTTLSILTIGVTALSLGLAFALPGHIELLAITFLINLPLLFSSTALAPLEFMPVILRWLACLNPLTYAIEPIRAAYQGPVDLGTVVLHAPYGDVSSGTCIWILLTLTIATLILVRPLLHRKLS